MEERLRLKLDYLYIMQEKYNNLNNKTKGAYRWRYNAITEQINALEGLRDNEPNNDWNECYEEEDDKGVNEMDTPGGTQKLIVINESGLYSLVFGSKLEKAKVFKRLVSSSLYIFY